jgi:hypothetical protein
MSEDVLRLLAAAEEMPVETDAPPTDATSTVPYDPGLQQELLDLGPEALTEYGMIVVRDVQKQERYNSAVWYALGHGLRYELKENCVIITDPASK